MENPITAYSIDRLKADIAAINEEKSDLIDQVARLRGRIEFLKNQEQNAQIILMDRLEEKRQR